MNRNEQFKDILGRYRQGKATPEETAWLESGYLNWNKGNQRWYAPQELDELRAQAWENIVVKADLNQGGLVSPSRVSLWPRIVTAAAAVALVVLGVYFFNYNHKTIDHPADLMTQDIAPGKSGATLTLASGKKIRLTDAANGELATESGVSISKSADGQLVYEIKGSNSDSENNKINTLSTAKGETYQLRLPDGSLVYLNAASSLTYSANLNERGKRRVKLDGEGYFQVAKDKAHPFVVQTTTQEVEVLGTEFNVNSYKDETAVATTLVEGSVKVKSGSLTRRIVPGEQVLNNGSDLKVTQVNLDNVVDWKDGEFNLDNLDFRTAMRKIARWYDVEVIYDKSVPEDIEAGGWIPRDNKLSSILKLIENSGQVKFRINGKQVYVYK